MSSTDAAAHATTEPGATHLPIAGGKGTWRYSLRVFGRRPWLLAATAVVMAGASLAGLATPAVLGWMVDAVVTGRAAALPWAAAVLAGAALLSAGLAAAGAVMMATVGQRGLAEMREEVFGAAVAQPPEAVERAGTGDLVSRVSDDVEAVNTAIGGILPTFVSALFTVALTLGGLGLIDLRFALAAVLCVPIQWFALRRFMRASAPLYRTMRMAESERGQHVLEAAGGADTVRSLGQETPALARVAEASLRAISLSLSSVVVRSRFFGRLNVAELVGLAAVLTTGYLLVAADAVTVGAATAAALFFHQLFNPIGVLLANVDELQKAGAGLARLVGVAESSTVDDAGPPGSPGPPAPAPPAGGDGGLVVDRVAAGYEPGRPVLRDFSLTIPRGQTVALVGSSGAGKSTLARILAGSLPSESGTVAWRGAARTLGNTTVLVSQEVHVFSGTVAENLRLARPSATAADLQTAVADAGAQWIADLPEGLDTVVGQDGHRLHGDQAQHLALARALLTDAPVVILDEATAEAGSASAGA
ncbi:MAG: ABC transporter ATP-binding protein, partial [Citricoccus sp.]